MALATTAGNFEPVSMEPFSPQEVQGLNMSVELSQGLNGGVGGGPNVNT
jgi:hypothetical protein